jgi:hypothetical protein
MNDGKRRQKWNRCKACGEITDDCQLVSDGTDSGESDWLCSNCREGRTKSEPSICEWYAAKVRDVVNEWDGQDTEDLVHEIYNATGEKDLIDLLKNGINEAWSIIANVSGGEWSIQHRDWRKAAEKFRDDTWKKANEMADPKACAKDEPKIEPKLDATGVILVGHCWR